MALRDVGRVLGMTYAEVDVISKLMPDKLGITLDEAIELEPRIKEQMDLNPQINTLMDLARKVEGLLRNAGIHAAGVVIASQPLVQLAPLYRGDRRRTGRSVRHEVGRKNRSDQVRLLGSQDSHAHSKCSRI